MRKWRVFIRNSDKAYGANMTMNNFSVGSGCPITTYNAAAYPHHPTQTHWANCFWGTFEIRARSLSLFLSVYVSLCDQPDPPTVPVRAVRNTSDITESRAASGTTCPKRYFFHPSCHLTSSLVQYITNSSHSSPHGKLRR